MNKLTENIILNTDSYKTSHFGFMEPGTTRQFSYIEARKGGEYKTAVVFGSQIFIKTMLDKPVTTEMVEQAEKFLSAHGLPFNREGWEYIVSEHEGRLPLRIRAVDEGTLVPEGNVMVTVENTDDKCAWLTSYIETALLRAIWYGTTVATRSFKFRNLIEEYLEKTGDPSTAPFKFVDFGARGASSKESSEIAGAAHLINFMSTDNIVGIAAAMEYYNSEEMLGFSIAASEHTVIISWGKDREKEFFENAIETYGGEGKMVSVVSDTYDFDKALDTWVELRDKIEEIGGTVVVRPDSGYPTDVVLHTLKKLEEGFGSTTNEKGYRVLNPAVRVIQGDGVDLNIVEEILMNMEQEGFSADNVTFGCGGFLLQDLTRDTLRFAMKGSYVEVNGEARDVRKTTLTDPTKASKAGRLTLVKRWGVREPLTIKEGDKLPTDTELLHTIFEDGEIKREVTFDQVRENARKSW